MIAFFPGFAIGLSLILAIGAQNAFVLRQGIRRMHVGMVVATCAISDAILIVAGVAGFGTMVEAAPWIDPAARWSAAIFLGVYGAHSLKRAILDTETLSVSGSAEQSRLTAFLTCLAFTWLNPHVYLDTLVMIGAISSQYGADRWWFGAGAASASATFFISLGYGAKGLTPIFARPMAWRLLDVSVAAVVWAIATTLILA